jgi:hypothetical protein
MKIKWLSFLVLLFPLSALAQTGIYAAFSASSFDLPGLNWEYGPTVGVYHDFYHPPLFSIGADLRGSFLGSGSTKAYSGLIGPHLKIDPPVFPLHPYAEVLAGVGHVEYETSAAFTDTTKFTYQLLAGVDFTIFPRIDWRIVEFSYGGFTGLEDDFHPKTLSMGFVVRLP